MEENWQCAPEERLTVLQAETTFPNEARDTDVMCHCLRATARWRHALHLAHRKQGLAKVKCQIVYVVEVKGRSLPMRWPHGSPATKLAFEPLLQARCTMARQVCIGNRNPSASVRRVCFSVLAHAINGANVSHAKHVELPTAHATLTSGSANSDDKVSHCNAERNSELHRAK